MTDLKRNIRCANCGFDAIVTISSDLTLSELVLSGKCSRCSSAMQLNYSVIGQGPSAPVPPTQSAQPEMINLDESLFTPEIPSNAIRDLMED